MQQTTRTQGYAICGGAGIAALLFLIGIVKQIWWALAIPVAILTLFVLGLVAWVGFTIATIQVEADQTSEILSTDAASKGAANTSATAEDAA